MGGMRCSAGWLAALALVLAACDAGWLHERGLRVIREVDVGGGARLLEDPTAVLLQVRGPDWRGPRVEGTELVASREPLPAELAGASHVVILAEDVGEGLRMAARLSRAGIQRVAVVRGGVAAWQAAREPAAPGAAPAG